MNGNLSGYTTSGYTNAVTLGIGIGLRLALDAINAERVRLTATRPDSKSPSAACHAYADGRLMAVMRVIAVRFRQ
jgi:hypothetical protein